MTQLSHDKLVNLVLEQQAEIEALRMKLDKCKKPPINSGNSSQPPSQDQKGNQASKQKRHTHGPPKGHAKFERKFVSPLEIKKVKGLKEFFLETPTSFISKEMDRLIDFEILDKENCSSNQIWLPLQS